jgi:hypothetical protein
MVWILFLIRVSIKFGLSFLFSLNWLVYNWRETRVRLLDRKTPTTSLYVSLIHKVIYANVNTLKQYYRTFFVLFLIFLGQSLI